MARALVEAGIRPDVVLGTSIGAVNGAALARDPGPDAVELLTRWWSSDATAAFSSAPLDRLRTMTRTALHTGAGPARAARHHLRRPPRSTTSPCLSAAAPRRSSGTASTGSSPVRVVPALMASCAVPGLFPPFRVGDEHFVDGGLVNSIPVSRAVELGGADGLRPPGRTDRAPAAGAHPARGRSRRSRSRSPGGTGSPATSRPSATASPCTCCPPGTTPPRGRPTSATARRPPSPAGSRRRTGPARSTWPPQDAGSAAGEGI